MKDWLEQSAKVQEIVEESFPDLVRRLGTSWGSCWQRFVETKPDPPVALKFSPDVFLEYFLKTDALLYLKELARFERQLELHASNHRPVTPVPMDMIAEVSQVILSPYEVLSFKAPVTKLYAEEDCSISEEQTVIFWLTNEGVQFRAMQKWELYVLAELHYGVEVALTHAPDDAEEVAVFFKWLGQSQLVRKI